MTPSNLKHFVKIILQPEYRKKCFALQKLRNMPRYTPATTNLFGIEIELIDAASFLFMYNEIFEQQIYRFKTKAQKPTIIDCGANIGLSVLYFKKLFPNCCVIAFEPDSKAFKALENNIKKHLLSDIDLINKAVWSSETFIKFMSEGADGGRIVQVETDSETYQVSTVRLRDLLNQSIDFLKLDIEGAETEVLKDCHDLLSNVKSLFVEYHSFVNEEQTLHIITNILSKAGFRVHIHPPFISPQPLYYRRIHLGMDMQLNIFAFRE